MLWALRGKLLIGGLIFTAFAKAAVSFPILATPDNAFPPDLVVQAKATAKEEPDPEEEAPPSMVDELKDAPEACLVPETVLQSLTEERDLIANQKKALDGHESEIKLAREKLNIEKAALLELRGAIEQLLNRVDAQQTEDLERLIAFYQNMKPTEAAVIMNEMDIEVVILVMGKMKPRVAAPILAKMVPVRARAVSKIILERSKLPGDQNLQGVRID